MATKKNDDDDKQPKEDRAVTEGARQDDKQGGGRRHVSTAAEGEDDLTDVSGSELPDARPTTAEEMPPEVEPVKVETIQSQGIGPRDPYPTGNPPAALSHGEIHGYVPNPEDPSGTGRAVNEAHSPNQGVQPIKGSDDARDQRR